MKAFVDANLLIYLNTVKSAERRRAYEEFYLTVLQVYKASTDVLVLDEVLYVSWKRYHVPYETTLDFLATAVLPYVEILTLGNEEYETATELLKKYRVNPSDALHAGAMMANGISNIASEDKEFETIRAIERIWFDVA